MSTEDIIKFLGSMVCHQNPERCFYLDDKALPLCIRCTGIYLGYFWGRLGYLFARDVTSFPKYYWWLFAVIGLGMTIFEFAFENAKQNESLKSLRSIGAYLIGLSISFLLIPLIGRIAFEWHHLIKESTRSEIARLIVALIGMLIIILLGFRSDLFSWWAVALASMLGLLWLLLDLATLVGMSLGFQRKKEVQSL